MFGVRFWLGKIWHCLIQPRKSVTCHRIPSDADVRHSRHPWQLNESRFILTASNACLFLAVAARDILSDNLKADWPRERVMANLGSTTISLTNLYRDHLRKQSKLPFWTTFGDQVELDSLSCGLFQHLLRIAGWVSEVSFGNGSTGDCGDWLCGK